MDTTTDSLDVYVRGASHLYKAASDKYSSLSEAVEIQEPPMPVLVDRPRTDLPVDISQKVEEYGGLITQGMDRNKAEAKRYLDAALYVLCDVYFHKMNVEKDEQSDQRERYNDFADGVWDSFMAISDKAFLHSIDQLMKWFGEKIEQS